MPFENCKLRWDLVYHVVSSVKNSIKFNGQYATRRCLCMGIPFSISVTETVHVCVLCAQDVHRTPHIQDIHSVLKFAKWPNAFFFSFFFFLVVCAEDEIILFRWKRYHNQFAQCFVATKRKPNGIVAACTH